MNSVRTLSAFSFTRLAAIAVAAAAMLSASGCLEPARTTSTGPETSVSSDVSAASSPLIGTSRQLTFSGARSGEGYFSADGRRIVFQSEREPGNPFYQIYLLDLESGKTHRISPGQGKTTCAWIHPAGDRVLFASTHADPQSLAHQKEELEARASGNARRYSWDYDPWYDIYETDPATGTFKNLTNATGYDAEGCYSPDGRFVVFSSNRHAYSQPLPGDQKALLEKDPSYFLDLYLLEIETKKLTRLTDSPGYDGGPFFSADGKKICWRRFSADGATAEIFTMNTDGTGERQLTNMGVMSWAPFFHPGGAYLIFTTNKHGFDNFELYLVDADGRHEPVRASDNPGFDGLPVFHPDGRQLLWTSNRSGSSQLHLAPWNHQAALRRLGLSGPDSATAPTPTGQTDPAIRVQDLKQHVEYLASPALEGRMTGTRGERLATDYIAGHFRRIGLQPDGDENSFFETFSFTAGAALGHGNKLALQGAAAANLKVDADWRPLPFSATGDFQAADIVFAGYGLSISGDEISADGYDSFVHLDVKDKWVMVIRGSPKGWDQARQDAWASHGALRRKAMVVRDLGARGIVFIAGPNPQVQDELVPLGMDATLGGSSLAAVSLKTALADQWLKAAGRNLKKIHDELDQGGPAMGFTLPDIRLQAVIDVQKVMHPGRNVLGRLQAGAAPSASVVVIGAHLDHLGQGPHPSSRGQKLHSHDIHVGADDNASGIAGLIEIAEWLADRQKRGELKLAHDIVFAGWSGEELGLLGSAHHVRRKWPHPPHTAAAAEPAAQTVPRPFTAYLNMDMIGRYREKLALQGIGSSSRWTGWIEQANVSVGLPLALSQDCHLPTDTTSFYLRGAPILSAFTGVHEDYHLPTDTPEKLDYNALQKIADLMGRITLLAAQEPAEPDYQFRKDPGSGKRASLRAYLGTIPDYSEDVKGLKLSGVAKGGPAEKAGLRAGDIVIELAGRKVENIYDYTHAIEVLKIGQPVKVIVLRGSERVDSTLTPTGRDH